MAIVLHKRFFLRLTQQTKQIVNWKNKFICFFLLFLSDQKCQNNGSSLSPTRHLEIICWYQQILNFICQNLSLSASKIFLKNTFIRIVADTFLQMSSMQSTVNILRHVQYINIIPLNHFNTRARHTANSQTQIKEKIMIIENRIPTHFYKSQRFSSNIKKKKGNFSGRPCSSVFSCHTSIFVVSSSILKPCLCFRFYRLYVI